MSLVRSLTLPAHAKLNWTLDVLGSFDAGHPNEGFTNLVSVLVLLDLHDDVKLSVNPEGSGKTNINCSNNAVPQTSASNAELNSAFKATSSLRKRFPKLQNVDISIEIEKRIPLSGGLGGSSTDGSATLLGLNSLLNLELDNKSLIEIAAEFGSDTPFFASGFKTAKISGRGETIQKLPTLKSQPGIICINPGKELYVGEVFKSLQEINYCGCAATTKFVNSNKCEQLLNTQAPLEELCSCVSNDLALAPAVGQLLPNLKEITSWLCSNGCLGAALSGSGPTIFGITHDKSSAEEILRLCKIQFPDLTSFTTRLL